MAGPLTLLEFGQMLQVSGGPWGQWGDQIVQVCDEANVTHEGSWFVPAAVDEDRTGLVDAVTGMLDDAKIASADDVALRVEAVLQTLEEITLALDGEIVDDPIAKRVEDMANERDEMKDDLADLAYALTTAGLIDDTTPRSEWSNILAMFLPTPPPQPPRPCRLLRTRCRSPQR